MYVGTAYHGWQVQKNAVTVCETLQKALEKITGAPVHLTGCGRTDAGVHARVYIANFRTTSRIPVGRLPYALNTHLPLDIVVTEAREVPEGFNAIGSCVKKEYTYLIYNSAIKDPFYVNRAWFYPKHLDEKVMQLAGSQFVGTHESARSARRSNPRCGRSTITRSRVRATSSRCASAQTAFSTTWRGPWPGRWSTRRKGSSRRNRWRKFWNAATARLQGRRSRPADFT